MLLKFYFSGCRADPVMDENGRLSVNLGDV